MKSKPLFFLYVAVAMVQLAVPVDQIRIREDILRNGTAYKFRTAPVDPSDAFRGRYVALSYADTLAPFRPGESLLFGNPAYVVLNKDAQGFANFGELSPHPPNQGDFLRVTFQGGAGGDHTGKASFRLPFDRFFMEESKAPRAEAAYWRQGNRRRPTEAPPTYVLVRVKDGRGVIEDLFIDNRPIRDFLDTETAEGR